MAPPKTRRDKLAGLAALAFRSFAGTFVLILLFGGLLAGASFYFLRDYPLLAGIAAAIAILEAFGAGLFLGLRRMFFHLLSFTLRAQGLGRMVVRLLFDKVIGLAKVSGAAEKVPLAQAEGYLSEAVRTWMGTGQKSWLRRKVEQTLLGGVQALTLTRFRQEGQNGVNLALMQEELENHVEERLVTKMRGGLNVWTGIVLVGLPALIALQTFLLLFFFQQQ